MIGLLWVAVVLLALVVWLLCLVVTTLKDDLIALHADVVKAAEVAHAARQVATATARWAFDDKNGKLVEAAIKRYGLESLERPR